MEVPVLVDQDAEVRDPVDDAVHGIRDAAHVVLTADQQRGPRLESAPAPGDGRLAALEHAQRNERADYGRDRGNQHQDQMEQFDLLLRLRRF